MANYQGAERTNYVRIREEKLHDVAEYVRMFNIEMHEKDGTYCFTPFGYTDDGCFNAWCAYEDDDGRECEAELDWAEVALCMEEGQVLVILSAGHEKLRYISGYAQAWDWRGNCVGLSLNEIYRRASEAFEVPFDSITDCSY